ncbi:CREM protein, partial [Polyodon spathula]|nr:CREM protein [Polyodon spathula]
PMTMETVVDSQQDGSASDCVSDREAILSQSTHSPVSTVTQVSGAVGGSPAVTVVQLPGGQTVQVQGVIQATQQSVIQSPQIQTVQIAAIAETDESQSAEGVTDSKKRREILSRRPSYRKILNELSSDTPGVPKIEEEKSEEEVTPSNIATMAVPTSIYQTSTGQYIAIAQGGTIQIANPGSDGVQGLQTFTMTNSGTPQPGATILQYATQSSDGTQQFFVPGSQVVVQGDETEFAATGDMPTYQIRTPTSSLPQGVVMAASPGSLHSPQQLADEVTRKREHRLMKNRDAAKECRRRKKEYVKCLESRVGMLEVQNKKLIEELESLKDIYVDQEFLSEKTDSDGATPVVHVSLLAELLPLIKRATDALNVPWPVDDKRKHSVFKDDPAPSQLSPPVQLDFLFEVHSSCGHPATAPAVSHLLGTLYSLHEAEKQPTHYRQLWLSPARIADGDKAPLLDAPITPGHTFGPAVDDMLQRSHRARESMKELVCLLPKKQLPAAILSDGIIRGTAAVMTFTHTAASLPQLLFKAALDLYTLLRVELRDVMQQPSHNALLCRTVQISAELRKSVLEECTHDIVNLTALLPPT